MKIKKSEIEYRLRRICGKPSPLKRLVAVSVAAVIFAAVNVYFLAGSIYSIGRDDAQRELMKIEHIEVLKIPQNDSINLLKQKLYEYEFE